MAYYLGIDLGTSYFKAGVFDDSGKLLGLGRVQTVFDSDGTVCELPVERFWLAIRNSVSQAVNQAGIDEGEIIALGYSSQANSFTVLDKQNNPLTPLIIWTDSRSDLYPQVENLWAEPDFMTTTGIGNNPSAALMVNKLLWIRDKQPQIWAQTASVKTISDYLIFGLTGENISDWGTSSLLGFVDVKNKCRWDKALNFLDLNEQLFGKLYPTGKPAGKITLTGSRLIGLKKGTTAYTGSLDHYMAALGAGVGTAAQMSESTGTVIACVNTTPNFNPKKGICVSNGLDNGDYFQLTFDGNGAVSLEWYQKLFAPNYSFAELDEMAKRVGSCDGLKAMPKAFKYKGLDAFEGVRPNHTHGHFFRALLENISLTLNELIERLSPNQPPATIASTGGGAKSDFWLSLKSQLNGKSKFIPTDCQEPACKGAAMICRN